MTDKKDDAGVESAQAEEPTRKLLTRKKRISYAILGFLVLAIGVVMLPAPGPGTPIVLAGLALLAAADILWARRLHRRIMNKGRHVGRFFRRKKNTPPAP